MPPTHYRRQALEVGQAPLSLARLERRSDDLVGRPLDDEHLRAVVKDFEQRWQGAGGVSQAKPTLASKNEGGSRKYRDLRTGEADRSGRVHSINSRADVFQQQSFFQTGD